MERGCGHEAELQALRRRVTELERTIAELRQKLDEAQRASKRQAAPFSKGPPKAEPKPPGRKAGDAYGPKAHREPPAQVDQVIPVELPEACPCGGELEWVEAVQQYQTEIPRKPIHRRFDIAVGCCRRCGRRVQGRHPLQTSDALGAAASQLGPDAQAMAALMKNKLGASYGDIQTAFSDFFGIELTRGGAAQTVLRVGQRIQAAYRAIEGVVRRSRKVYPDETGWKVEGVLWWKWVFVTSTVTLFTIRHSRGHDVPEEILGLGYSGTMIHDGWSPYDAFEQALHQQCLAHLMRRARELLLTAKRGAVRFPRQVLELLGDAFGLRDRRDGGEISRHGLAVAVGRLEARLLRLLCWHRANPANERFAKHLWAHQNQIFTFLKIPGIEATSWPADQAIRPAVVNRKVFGGNREVSGARAQERLASIVATCLQRGVEVFGYLSQVLRSPDGQRDRQACRLLALPAPP
jgi:transposase